jgi:predicted transporter
MRKWVFVYSALACACVALFLLIVWAMGGLGELRVLSHDGAVALGLAIGFTVVLAIVLMGLSFYSARKGHDDKVMDGHPTEHNTIRRRR